MRKCKYPPGCDAPAMPDRNACQPHYILVSALMGNPDEPGPTDEEIAWANRVVAA